MRRADPDTVVITHPEKVLFPDNGITKGELCAYYEAIAPLMLPHIRGRPITMERYPAGIEKKGFIQKDVVEGVSRAGSSASRSRSATTRRGDGGGALPAGRRRAIAGLARQPELDHAARLDLARARSCTIPICACSISIPPERSGGAADGGAGGARSARRTRAAVVREDVGVEGLPHPGSARRRRRLRAGSGGSRTAPARCWSSATRRS